MASDRELLNELRRLEELEAKASGKTVSRPASKQAPQKRKQQRQPPNMLGLPALMAEGATFGFAPKIAAGLGAPIAKGALEAREAITGQEAPTLGQLYRSGVEQYQGLGQQARENFPVSAPIAEIGGGVTGSIGAAGTAPVRAIGSLARKGGLAGRIAAGAGLGELGQRTYEAGTGEVGEEAETLARSGVSLGGVLGGAIPASGAVARQAKKAITPAVKQGAEKVVSIANKYNIPLGLDDLTDDKFYQHLIQKGSNLPLAGKSSDPEKQLKAFTKAVAKSVGLEDVDSLTPENMDKAFTKVGRKFDNLTKGKTFDLTDDALQALSEIEEGAARNTYGATGLSTFQSYVDDVFKRLQDDVMSGEDLARLRNQFARISRSGTNPDAKALAKDMEDVLVNMIGEDAPQALKNAKYQYKNLIAIEPLAQNAQIDGFISPARLSQRVKTVYKRDFTRGKAGELGDLALLGQAIKQRVPDSGTSIGNVILGTMTGGNIPLAFLSPAAGAAQATGMGAGILGNRLLQARNINPDVISRALYPVRQAPIQTPLRLPLATGAALGSLDRQEQQ